MDDTKRGTGATQDLPELGTVTGLSVSRDTSEILFGFNSFVVPTSVFRLADAIQGELKGITNNLSLLLEHHLKER